MLEEDNEYKRHFELYKKQGLEFLNQITQKILASEIDVYIAGHNHVYEHDIVNKKRGGIIHSFIIGTGTDLRPVDYDNLEEDDQTEVLQSKEESGILKTSKENSNLKLYTKDSDGVLEVEIPFLTSIKNVAGGLKSSISKIKEGQFGLGFESLSKSMKNIDSAYYFPSFLKIWRDNNILQIRLIGGEWRKSATEKLEYDLSLTAVKDELKIEKSKKKISRKLEIIEKPEFIFFEKERDEEN